jgi:hypothetical protein
MFVCIHRLSQALSMVASASGEKDVVCLCVHMLVEALGQKQLHKKG